MGQALQFVPFNVSHVRDYLRLAMRKFVVSSSVLALGGIGLTSGPAHALVVNVRGELWNISTYTGRYQSRFPFFDPWMFDPELSSEFARAVGQGFGLPNEVFCSPPGGTCTSDYGKETIFNNETPFRSGPLFAYTDGPVGDGGNFVDYVFSIAYLDDGVEYLPPDWLPEVLTRLEDSSVTWARATPVPGPLPIFGAAAAFAASRRLRKRVKASRNPLSSPPRN
jgi:hypothetical protein